MGQEQRGDACISIHALRVEGDKLKVHSKFKVAISIHALRVEGDKIMVYYSFLLIFISIHALRVEGDKRLFVMMLAPKSFLSTPSGWRATWQWAS